MKIGYLGPRSSFTFTATAKVFPKEILVPFVTIPSCLKALEDQTIDYAIVPIENSLEGTVNVTLDYLYHQANLKVQGELVLPIEQQLMVHPNNQDKWQMIAKIFSHQQALAQCQNFMADFFPDISAEGTSSTAFAAEYVANNPQLLIAAIAPKSSAEAYDLAIVKEDIQDVVANKTRFWILGNTSIATNLKEMQEKTSFSVTMPNNIPGSLHTALSAFSWRKINLSKIESRPLKTVLGEYFFLMDIVTMQPSCLVENAFKEIELLGASVKVFGTYPVYEFTSI